MDLRVGNWSTEATFSVIDDKDDYISISDAFRPFEHLETHEVSRVGKLPRSVGNGRLEYHCVVTNLTIVVQTMHDVIEHAYSKVPNIPPRTYAELSQIWFH